jgi:hypothetical protein
MGMSSTIEDLRLAGGERASRLADARDHRPPAAHARLALLLVAARRADRAKGFVGVSLIALEAECQINRFDVTSCGSPYFPITSFATFLGVSFQAVIT